MAQELAFRLSVTGQAQVVNATGEAERGLDRLGAAQGRVVQGANSAANALRNMVAALGIGISVKGIIDAADAVTNLQNSLKLATGSTQAAAVAYERLFEIAQASRTSFTELGGTYASIARAGQSLGLSQERLLTVTQAIGNAMAVGGGSAEGMKAALMQLGQGLSAGTLRGEELNSVMEQAPRLAQALAEGLGVTTGELRALGAAGALTSTRVIEALEKSAPQLAKEVQSATMTVGQAFTVLSNSATKFIGEADKATGASSTLAGAMRTLANGIDSVGETIRQNETAFAIIGGTLASAAAVAGILAVGKALTMVATAAGAIAAALAAPGVMALLGLGAVAGAGAAVVSAYSKTASGIKETIATLEELNTRSEAALKRAEGRPAAMANIQSTIDARKKQINDLKAELILLETPAVDNRAEEARTQRGLERLAQQKQSTKELAEIRTKLSGVDSDYLPTLEKLQRARELGTISEKDYISQVSELAKQNYKASDSQKAAEQAAKQNANRVRDLRNALDEKVAAGALELQQLAAGNEGQAKLTAGQSYALGLMEKLRTGEVKLTDAQKVELATKLALHLANERAITQAQAEVEARTKAREESDRNIDRLQQELRAQLERNRVIGLEGPALATVEAQRDRANIAMDEEWLRFQRAMGAAPEYLAQLEREIALRKSLADARRDGTLKGASQSALDSLGLGNRDIQKTLNLDGLKDAVSGLDGPLGQIVDRFQSMIDLQQKFAEQARQIAIAKQGDADQVAKALQAEARLASQTEQARLSGYASMASAAKGFFNEGSKGYQALRAAEQTFRAFELANAVKNAATQLGLIGGLTTAKVAGDVAQAASSTASATTQVAAAAAVGQANAAAAVANQGNGDPYSAFFRIAAMAAIMAALGYSTGALGGGGTAAAPVKNAGTGTVFGDADAKSESIGNALKQLTEVDTLTMRYSAEMLDALRSIESSLAGVTSLVLRNGALTTGGNLGIFQGTLSVNRGDPVLNALGLGGDTFASKLPGIGGTIAKLQSLWGKTTQEISSAGLYLNGLLSQLQTGVGVQQYADVKTTKSSMFGLSKKVSYGTQFAGVDDTIASQFAAIFSSFDAALDAAAGPLGVSLGAIEQRLTGFVVDIGRIDLKGLTGEQIQEKLSAVLGAAGDRIAAAALPGLQRYQAVGEGYLETVVRVAYTVETVSATLKRLGVAALQAGEAGTAAAMSLADAFGGLDELTKQTAAYYEAIYSDGDKLALSQQRLSDAFAQYMMKVPATTEDYRKLVEAQDLGTASGRAMYATLVQLAPAYAEVRNALDEQAASAAEAAQRLAEEAAQKAAAIAQERTGLEQQLLQLQGNSAELRRRELAALDPSNRALQARIYALQDAQAAEQTAAVVAQQRAGLEQQLLQLQGNTAALRGRELAALDPSLRALQQRIHLLQDEQAAEQAAQAIAQQRAGLEQQLLQLQGNTAELRRRELAELDPTNRSLQERIYILQETQAAEQAAAQAAQAAEQQRISLEQQLLQLQDNTAELRRRELAALDPSNRALQQQIYTLQEYQAAQQAATQAAQAAEQQRQALLQQQENMEQQLLQLQGATATLRQRELAALDPSLRALQQRIYALQDEQAATQAAQAVAQQREGLEQQLLQLQGSTAALRGLELMALDPSNRALQERIYALQDAQAAEQAATQAAQAVAQQREGLEQQLLQLQGDTAELRRRELAALDPSNRALQERIYALQDEQAAAAEALKLRDAWKALGETIADEIRRIRGLSSTGTARSFVELQAQFATTTAQARAGDQAAAKALPELSRSLLEAASGSAATASDLARIQAVTAASLEQTMRALSALGVEATSSDLDGSALLVGMPAPELEIAGPSRIYSAEQSSALLGPRPDTARLEAQVERLTELLEDHLAEAQATTTYAARTARVLERVSPDGDAIAVRTAE